MTSIFWAPMALVGGIDHENVSIEASDGKITSVSSGVPVPPGAVAFEGAMVPGLVNAHSHVFHRALRGRATPAGGDFWSWRAGMYELVDHLDPELLEELATATYAEMLAAGITQVGEFHYVHRGPGGVPYTDRNEMAMAIVRAAAATGIRLCLLDTCYLMADVDGTPLQGPQLRFGDGDVDGWSERHGRLADELAGTEVVVGSAIHSVRGVPADAFAQIVEASGPTHVHASEQAAENRACVDRHGVTPIGLLARHGGLRPGSTVVHAIHVTSGDLEATAGSGASVCVCPTTELDLGDGTADVAAFAAAGIDVSLGSDSHAVVDLLVEARMVEWNDRARYGRRGVHASAALWDMATSAGARSLGCERWGLEVGAPADFAVLDTRRPATAGIDRSDMLLSAATAGDVMATVVGGEIVCEAGEHHTLGSVSSRLASAIGRSIT
jgi:formiminoglutamate deiminase